MRISIALLPLGLNLTIAQKTIILAPDTHSELESPSEFRSAGTCTLGCLYNCFNLLGFLMNRGRFGRGGGGRGRGGRGGGRGGFRRGGGGGRRGGDPRQSSDAGNKRERISIESGYLVFIDQFMLANPQFIDRLKSVLDESAESKDALVKDFGGSVVNLTPGTYRIDRDPFESTILVHQEGERPDTQGFDKATAQRVGEVVIDTRCVAMIDRELLDDTSLLEKYQQLWFSGQDKACRDLLRDNGGAVRYGFQRNGDELSILTISDATAVCLSPVAAS